MNVLHVTTWYPNDVNAHEARWVKRHICALAGHVEQYFVLHLEVKPGRRLRFSKGDIDRGIRRRLELPFNSWFIIEFLTAFLLTYYLWKLRRRNFNIINFHIGYPTLVYWHLLKRWFKVTTVVTEHWSAYHFNFGLDSSKSAWRIKRIFCQNIPVIAVSNALASDIKSFSGCSFPVSVVPNVVDGTIFYPDETYNRQDFFFMVSQWKWPKQPLVVLEAFKEFVKTHSNYKLKIAGYGPDYQQLDNWISSNDMRDSIVMLGPLEPPETARYFRTCRAFLHCTEYETFSVVCAEALSCGAPVLASRVGGVKEVVRDNEGLLLDSQSPEAWKQAMKSLLHTSFEVMDPARFSSNVVGKEYFNVLSKLLG